jgi:hypothetical protein
MSPPTSREFAQIISTPGFVGMCLWAHDDDSRFRSSRVAFPGVRVHDRPSIVRSRLCLLIQVFVSSILLYLQVSTSDSSQLHYIVTMPTATSVPAAMTNGHSHGDEKPGLKVLIVGAGVAGLCAAIGLRRQGHEVHVSEAPGTRSVSPAYILTMSSPDIRTEPIRHGTGSCHAHCSQCTRRTQTAGRGCGCNRGKFDEEGR